MGIIVIIGICRDITPTVENQLDNRMENQMETGALVRRIEVIP